MVTALALMGYFISRGGETTLSDPYRAISPKACLVIETVDLKSFLNSLTSGEGIFGEITAVNEFSTFSRKLKFLADIMNKTTIRELSSDKPSLISFYASSEGRLNTMITMAMPASMKFRQLKQAVSVAGITDALEFYLNGEPVLSLPYVFNDVKDTVFISLSSGLVMISGSGDIIKESRNTLAGKADIRNMPGFSSVLTASGKNQDKIFLNFKALPSLIRPLLDQGSREAANSFAGIASNSGADIYLTESGITFSGYSGCADSTGYLSHLISVTPAELQSAKILPASTALFETIRLPDDFRKDRSDSDLGSVIIDNTAEEITRAYLDISDTLPSENVLMIYQLKNAAAAEQEFLNVAGDAERLYFQPDDQVKIAVYKLAFNGFSDPFLQASFGKTDAAYFSFFDNYLVSGRSYEAITKLLNDNLLNNTLINDLTYREFEGTMPSRASYFFFCVPSHIIQYLEGFLNEDIIRGLKQNKASLYKIPAAGFRLSPGNNMIYNSLSLLFRESVEKESLTEWETKLDTTAAIKPFFFTNHLTGAKEIFVQDVRNNIYLVNAAGRVLWKVPLNERISGNIFMIDYYGNRKYQLLFSGKNYLHVIDRNGNYVERFPVKLRSPATNSIALFDYDENRNYRILIAGEDRNIYSYDKSGSVVKGWKPFRTAGTVRSELSYFKVSGKDFLAVSDDKSLYLLDRYGNRRITFTEPVSMAEGSALKLINGRETYLVCSSPEGQIQQIFLDGTVKRMQVATFSPQHSFNMFDIDGDGSDEYVFVDGGKLFLYDHDRTELFTKELGSRISGPLCFDFSATGRKIGVLDPDKNLIYLLDKNGDDMDGFPLKGSSLFSIGRLTDKNGWRLIVGGPDKFLYNYKIEIN
jgi:WD40 repeat protein